MFDEKYYSEKKNKIIQRKQINLQKFVNAGFEFTNEAVYLDEQIKELELQELESKSQLEKSKK